MNSRHQSILWKYGTGNGIVISDNKITVWPAGLGVRPTKAQWDALEVSYILASERTRMLVEVDTQAEAARGKFITPGGGQAMAYNEKAREATACLAKYSKTSLPPVGTYPLLESEVGITAPDVIAVAISVDNKRQTWKTIEAQINVVRLTAKQAISIAVDVPAMQSVMDGLVWP